MATQMIATAVFPYGGVRIAEGDRVDLQLEQHREFLKARGWARDVTPDDDAAAADATPVAAKKAKAK